MERFEELNKNIMTTRASGKDSILKSNNSIKKETEVTKEVKDIQIEEEKEMFKN